MRSMYSKVESIGPDQNDPSRVEIRLAPTPGLADPTLGIARDQIEGFLAILGLANEDELVGRRIRVTLDDDEASERISFLSREEPARALEPVAFPPAGPEVETRGVPVMAEPAPAGEITVYDGAGADWKLSETPEEDCDQSAASLTSAEQAIEDKARAELAVASTAPLEARYFMYRETYAEGARPSVIELTPEEFALLGGSGTYLHVDDCTVVGAVNMSPDTVQGIERLLERATTRPSAALPRLDLERLAAAGRVVSCAVY